MRYRKSIIVFLIVYGIMSILGLVVLRPFIQEQLMDFFSRNDEMVLLFACYSLMSILVSTTLICSYATRDIKNNVEKSGKSHYSINFVSRKRENLEREIAELNGRLVASEENWKNAYHLLLSSQTRQLNANSTISTHLFLKSFGIDSDNITIKNDFVFVLTPFHPDFESVYDNICETCRSLKLTAMRSDEEYVKTNLLKHIIKSIVEARIIVANIDGRNANVFYELGIAHALNKPTILISKVDSSVPFDVQGQYMVLYSSASDLKNKLSESLLKVLTSNNH